MDAVESDRRKAANTFRAAVFGAQNKDRVIAFVCECGREDCKRTVVLTADEYVRARPGLILHESHDQDVRGAAAGAAPEDEYGWA
jgi:hypothetical protein